MNIQIKSALRWIKARGTCPQSWSSLCPAQEVSVSLAAQNFQQLYLGILAAGCPIYRSLSKCFASQDTLTKHIFHRKVPVTYYPLLNIQWWRLVQDQFLNYLLLGPWSHRARKWGCSSGSGSVSSPIPHSNRSRRPAAASWLCTPALAHFSPWASMAVGEQEMLKETHKLLGFVLFCFDIFFLWFKLHAF